MSSNVMQVFQPWIQQRRLAYAKRKHIISGILIAAQRTGLGQLMNEDGSPNKDVLRKSVLSFIIKVLTSCLLAIVPEPFVTPPCDYRIFHAVDEDHNGSLSHSELRGLVVGIHFEVGDLKSDDAVDKVMRDFDTSNDGSIDQDEFVKGMCKWLDEARNTVSNSRNYSKKFFDDFHAISHIVISVCVCL